MMFKLVCMQTPATCVLSLLALLQLVHCSPFCVCMAAPRSPPTITPSGVVSTCSAAIKGVSSFFAVRLLLGVFEAGSQAAMMYAITQFFPQER